MISIFFAYSHRDEEVRNELEIHLTMLKRQGIINTWHDRRIEAGEEIDKGISESLKNANIILLLVSPYFIASDYCYDREMRRAMEQHEACTSRVIPVILDPCDWEPAPFGKLNAVPTDGKPISKFPNRHDAFLEIVKAIRSTAEKIIPIKNFPISKNEETAWLFSSRPAEKNVKSQQRSSNLRIKKNFSQREKDVFLAETFQYIANYFENSVTELQQRNPGTQAEFLRLDATHFRTKIYSDGEIATRCRIWIGGGGFSEGILYSSSKSDRDDSYNESLSIEEDGYSLFLKPLGMALRNRDPDEQLTQQGAAEILWAILIEPLQR